MWVVKLGGSLAESAALPIWLQTLAAVDEPVVIVPGGGPFADQVRNAQKRWRFSEETAHRMAILAMRQYGWMLAALSPGVAAADLSGLHARLADGVAVWLPAVEPLAAAGIPASWDITSDSLAAWLAGWLGATHLALVKSAPAERLALSRAELGAQGIVDRAFERFTRAASFEIALYGRDEHPRFAEAASRRHVSTTRSESRERVT
jgi:hypothetical protein